MDLSVATKLYQRLANVGADPWLDEQNLRLGDEWEPKKGAKGGRRARGTGGARGLLARLVVGS